MREIKFRAWDKEEKEMVSWKTLIGCCDLDYLFGNVNETPKRVTIPDFEVMQYTGLKDKNDVEVYEGDILMAGDAYLGVIEYHSARAKFIGRNIGETFPEDEYDTLYTKNGRFNSAKVIGNIYENPELLEVSE